MFSDNILGEFQEWKTANPNNFSWWSYVNLKSDLQTSLAYFHFFYPSMLDIDGCMFLKDKFNENIYKDWLLSLENKSDIEYMMNLYDVKDFFHINTVDDGNFEEQVLALGKVLQHMWNMSFKYRWPSRNISAHLIEDSIDTQITVFQNQDSL